MTTPGPIRAYIGIRRGQGNSGLLVSAHLRYTTAPAGPNIRKPCNSANASSMFGTDLSRPLANIMRLAVTGCCH
jgi:hypothetical protein